MHQLVAAVAQIEPVTFCEIELDGVPVVDDRVGSFAPADPERRLPRSDRAGDIDGGLLVTDRAGLVSRVESAPLVGSRCSLVTPVRMLLRRDSRRGTQRTQRQTSESP